MAPGKRWTCARQALGWALLAASGSVAFGCAAPAAVPSAPLQAPAVPQRSSASAREHVALTVYSSGFALVREQRRLTLGRGRVALAYEDVSAHVQPETVHLSSLEGPGALVVQEQNYRYDLLTPRTLLEKYVGQRLRLARYDERRGEDVVVDAELLSVENGPVLRVAGEVVTPTASDRFILPTLPPSLLPRPTLVWLLDSEREEQRTELSYLTSGMSWHADYVLVLDASGTRGDLSGWVTLDNQTGTSFTGAALALVAGDVQRVTPEPPPEPELDLVEEQAANGGAGFQQEALFEYHMYSLQRPADVLDKEQKQVSLLEAHGSVLQRKLSLRADPGAFQSQVGGSESTLHPRAVLVLQNSADNALGMPLPAGVVRVYQADASGAQQFVGEDAIDHTPRDERVELSLGDAFDVVARRRQTAWRATGRCAAESSWEIALDNHKDAAARVEVIEPAGNGYQVLRASHPFEARDAQSFAFEVDVPARGKTQITYQVRVRWC